MTAGTPAPQDAEAVDEVEVVARALDETLAGYGIHGAGVIATLHMAEAALAALAPVRAREVEVARHHAFCEGVKAAGSYGHEDGWTHDVNPYLDNPYRHLAATHAETEES